MDLHALHLLSLKDCIERFCIDGTESNSWYMESIHGIRKLVSTDPGRCYHLERNRIANPNTHVTEFSQNACRRIKIRRNGIWNMRRRRNPLQACCKIIHLSLPSFHLNYLQIALHSSFQHPFTIEQESKFATCQTIDVRNRELAYKGKAPLLHHVSFHFQPA